MDTITQNETKFDSLFTNCSQQNNEDFLKEFSYLLEKYDDYLFSKRKACLRDSHLCGRLFFPKNSRKKTQKAENHLY